MIVPIGVLALAVLLHLWLGGRYARDGGTLLRRDGRSALSVGKGPGIQKPARASAALSRLCAVTPLPTPWPDLAPLFFIVLPAPHEQAEARRQAGTPIPVLLSYEGNVDPRRAPDLVVLRESDFQLLQQRLRISPAADGPGMILTDATHHLSWIGERDVVVESELTLRKDRPRVGLLASSRCGRR